MEAPGEVKLTCSALPLVSMGSVNAEIAHTMHTDEKRHRAPMKEALIRTCRQKTSADVSSVVWQLIKQWTKGHKHLRDLTTDKPCLVNLSFQEVTNTSKLSSRKRFFSGLHLARTAEVLCVNIR